MNSLGVMEIFYGKPWSAQDRHSYAAFLKEIGFEFYMYGPKADDGLRKNWRRSLKSEELNKYQSLQAAYSSQGLHFGIILSPYGLDNEFNLSDRQVLQDKIKKLSDIDLDYFGLFFDDMKSSPGLAERQLEILQAVQSSTAAKIVFCPSFYCNDPLLDTLFGDRPKHYLEILGEGLPQSVEILWTGEQIISPQITEQHLQDVRNILRRKPFVCDNFYSNDGPTNCNFLRLRPLSGRGHHVFNNASHWAFNPMNQSHLSKIVLLAAARYLDSNLEATTALTNAIQSLVPEPTAEFLLSHSDSFSKSGLDALSDKDKKKFRQSLGAAIDPFAQELLQWMNGSYSINILKMIDQSCYFSSHGRLDSLTRIILMHLKQTFKITPHL